MLSLSLSAEINYLFIHILLQPDKQNNSWYVWLLILFLVFADLNQ